MTQKERTELLYRSIGEKILVLDGAYGVQLQSQKLTEQDYQGEIFKGHSHPLKNNVDVLNITQPKIVAELHSEYLNAGADIITTNTFIENYTNYGFNTFVSFLVWYKRNRYNYFCNICCFFNYDC